MQFHSRFALRVFREPAQALSLNMNATSLYNNVLYVF